MVKIKQLTRKIPDVKNGISLNMWVKRIVFYGVGYARINTIWDRNRKLTDMCKLW